MSLSELKRKKGLKIKYSKVELRKPETAAVFPSTDELILSKNVEM